MFKVTTTDGTMASKGFGERDGMTEEEAQADAAKRNEQAQQLGIRTRYEVHPLADEREAA